MSSSLYVAEHCCTIGFSMCDPPTFMSHFGTYSVDMVCETEGNAHLYSEVIDTLCLLNCYFIWTVIP